MSDMKLIMENWRCYTEQRILSDIEFDVLLENMNTGKISRDRAIKLWENSMHARLEQILIQEGLGEDLMSAYEYVKGGVIKLKDTISDVALAAWEKVNNFLLEMSVQAYQMAVTSAEGIANAARALSNAVERFKDNHPIIYKIVKIVIVMIIIYGIIQLFSGSAEAALVTTSGKSVEEQEYHVLRGVLDSYGRGDIEREIISAEAIKVLDQAHQAKEAVNIHDLGKIFNDAITIMNKQVQLARGGDPMAEKILERWLEIGRTLEVGVSVPVG